MSSVIFEDNSISIHAPRVGRDNVYNCRCSLGYISIHAPRVGRDEDEPAAYIGTNVFQSTRPVWGATRKTPAPCAARCNFNPRAPCGARRNQHKSCDRHQGFQSTRPVWGATIYSYNQSFHNNFNPRAPCGARPSKSRSPFPHAGLFQSTRPVWGATICQICLSRAPSNFNPRAPCGARLSSSFIAARSNGFQSTRPVWGATTSDGSQSVRGLISIHAPRVGRDGKVNYLHVDHL